MHSSSTSKTGVSYPTPCSIGRRWQIFLECWREKKTAAWRQCTPIIIAPTIVVEISGYFCVLAVPNRFYRKKKKNLKLLVSNFLCGVI